MIDTTSMGIMANYMQPTSSTMASHMISKKDSDSSSSLSSEEMNVSSDMFSSIDVDLDGLASQSELATAIDTAMSQFDGEMPTKEEFQAILSSFGFDAPTQSTSTSSSSSDLSSTQLETIASVLENYDADNLSESDAQAIVAAFRDAGIEPGSDLETAMEEAGFDAKEVGTLAGVGPGEGGGGAPMGGGPGGGGGMPMSSSEDEEYDVMDTNQDGIVSSAEMQEYFTSSDEDTSTTATNQQNALDNLQLLMETLKSNTDSDSVDSSSFDGILKAINNQNNNSNLNTYLQTNNTTSSIFNYA